MSIYIFIYIYINSYNPTAFSRAVLEGGRGV